MSTLPPIVPLENAASNDSSRINKRNGNDQDTDSRKDTGAFGRALESAEHQYKKVNHNSIDHKEVKHAIRANKTEDNGENNADAESTSGANTSDAATGNKVARHATVKHTHSAETTPRHGRIEAATNENEGSTSSTASAQDTHDTTNKARIEADVVAGEIVANAQLAQNPNIGDTHSSQTAPTPAQLPSDAQQAVAGQTNNSQQQSTRTISDESSQLSHHNGTEIATQLGTVTSNIGAEIAQPISAAHHPNTAIQGATEPSADALTSSSVHINSRSAALNAANNATLTEGTSDLNAQVASAQNGTDKTSNTPPSNALTSHVLASDTTTSQTTTSPLLNEGADLLGQLVNAELRPTIDNSKTATVKAADKPVDAGIGVKDISAIAASNKNLDSITTTVDTSPAQNAKLATPTQSPEPYRQLMSVINPLRHRGDGDYQVTLKLYPEHLGSVEVSVSLQSGQINMQMSSDNAAARQALRDNMNQLRQELNSAGLSTGSLDVGDKSAQSQADNSNGSRHSQSSQAHNNGIAMDDDSFFARIASTETVSTAPGAPLDVRL